MKAAAVYEQILADPRLPSPGQVAVDLVALTRDPDGTIDDVARAIAMDPAISARVLRVVNAPTTGARRHVISIDQAVTILGMRAVARLAVEVSVLAKTRTGLAEFDYGAFWSESLARAVAARVLATWTKAVPADEAFTYGLLLGVGRLALVSVFPRQYRDLLLTLGSCEPNELDEAERAVFDVDAEELAASMMQSWGLAACHDALLAGDTPRTPAASRAVAMLQVCRAAGQVARVMVAVGATRAQIAVAVQSLAAMGVTAEVLANLFPDMVQLLHETAAQMQIEARAPNSLADVYAHAIDRT